MGQGYHQAGKGMGDELCAEANGGVTFAREQALTYLTDAI
jgi:hypothetical protein